MAKVCCLEKEGRRGELGPGERDIIFVNLINGTTP